MTIRRGVSLIISLGLLGASVGPGAEPSATFRTNSRLVLIPVSVTDRHGKTILGLRSEDFSIFDEQKPQRIASFSNEGAPCSVGLVLDVSGSMQRVLGSAKAVAQAFLRDANPTDEFLLLTVSTQPAAAAEFTTDVAWIQKSIAATTSGGFTALIDSVHLGLGRMRAARHARRALLVLSDGIDNHSRYTQTELMRAALEADVQVYTILMGDNSARSENNRIPFRPAMIRKAGDQAPERQGAELLEKLAEKTGGLHFRVDNNAQAKAAIARTGEAIRNRYLIGFAPPALGAAGKYHRVRVKANVPNVSVHARNGYYAP